MTPPDPDARAVPGEAGRDVGGASVGELVGEVTQDLSTLMRQELALAKAEVKQEAVKAGRAAGHARRGRLRRLHGAAVRLHRRLVGARRGDGTRDGPRSS